MSSRAFISSSKPLIGDEDDEHVNVVDGDEEDMMPAAKRRRIQQEQRNVLEEGKLEIHVFFNFYTYFLSSLSIILFVCLPICSMPVPII